CRVPDGVPWFLAVTAERIEGHQSRDVLPPFLRLHFPQADFPEPQSLRRSASRCQPALPTLPPISARQQHEDQANGGQLHPVRKQPRLCQHIPWSLPVPASIELEVDDESFSTVAGSECPVGKQFRGGGQGAFHRPQAPTFDACHPRQFTTRSV